MQKTPKKNVTMGIGFKLRSISKLCLLQYWIIKLFLWTKFIFFDRCNLVCLSCYIIHVIVHIAHFGILYLLQYEKSIFSMSRFFCPLHSMVYFYFILILYLLQYEKKFFWKYIRNISVFYTCYNMKNSIFSMSLFFCPLHSMVYFYFIATTIWKKNLSNVTPCNSITMILVYLLQYYFLYFIVVSKRNKQLQVDTIANIELPFN